MPVVDLLEIRWQRAVMEVTCRAGEEERIALQALNGQAQIRFDAGEEVSGQPGLRSFRLNLMTAEGRRPLSEGIWEIRASAGDGGKIAMAFAPDLLQKADDISRSFHYAGDGFTYDVRFVPKEMADGQLILLLQIGFFMRNPQPEHKKYGRYFEKKVFHALYRVMSMLSGRKGNRILFLKQNGEQPTENMKALKTRLIERDLDLEYRISERYHNVFGGKQKITAWLKDLLEIVRSDYIFIDDYAPVFNVIRLKEDVVLTQLWHAGVGFKSVGYARFGMDGSPDPYASSHRCYTYALTGNRYLRDIYSEVFGIEPQALLATGMPRLDHFLDPDTGQRAQAELYERYPALKNRRVILFAPTFRGEGQADAYYPYHFLDPEALYRLCLETDSIFVFKMHHFIPERPRIEAAYADRLTDLTDENLNALFYAADVLITDYSSCFYDYLLLEKPVILYTPDKTAYELIHGVQRPIDEMAPGEICTSFADLIRTLESGHYREVKPKALSIDRAAEGGMTASDRVIDTILLKKDVPGVRLNMEET